MSFISSSCSDDTSEDMVADAFATTSNFLDQLDPVELRFHSEVLFGKYRSGGSAACSTSQLNDPLKWREFLASQGDLMQKIGLQQKSIVIMGNLMKDWERQPCSFDELGICLDRLSSLVGYSSESLMALMLKKSIGPQTGAALTSDFSVAINALALLFVAIEQHQSDPDSEFLPALASFAAEITATRIRKLDVLASRHRLVSQKKTAVKQTSLS